jgi:hypothetical protein
MKLSPFISTKKEWTDEEYKIPADLLKGIKEVLKWDKPSKI